MEVLLKRKLTLKYVLILDKDLIEKSVLKRQVAVSIIRESKNRRVIIINFLIFLKIEIALFFLL